MNTMNARAWAAATAACLMLTTLGACGDEVTVQHYGFLRVTTTTTGGDFDLDGYTLLLNGDSTWIDLNHTWERSLGEGTHLVGLEDVASNCVGPEPQEVTVIAGTIAEIGFELTCAPAPELAGIRILFAGPTGLVLMNADGSDRVPLFDGSDPDLSPDGTRLLFARQGGIWVSDANGTNEELVIPGVVGSPRWSPDASRIAYSNYSNLDLTLWVHDLGDGSSAWLASTGNVLGDFPPPWPSFSPDGSEIAFSSYSDVELIAATGGPSTKLVRGSYPAWASDGRVAYVTGSSGAQYIQSVLPDGTGETTLVQTPFTTRASPREWSTDGKLLLYDGATPARGVDVYLLRTDDGTLVRVTADRASSGPIFWRGAP